MEGIRDITGSVIGHRILALGFKILLGFVGRIFSLSHHLIITVVHTVHLTYWILKRGHKTTGFTFLQIQGGKYPSEMAPTNSQLIILLELFTEHDTIYPAI